MARLCTPLLLATALAGACAPLPPRAPARADVDAALQSAAHQVRRCYRTPRVSSDGRQIVTQVRVRLTADGRLSGLPRLRWQMGVTPANEGYADVMAQAAIEAVMRCAPISLPPDLYAHGWTEFDLTFSPLAAA